MTTSRASTRTSSKSESKGPPVATKVTDDTTLEQLCSHDQTTSNVRLLWQWYFEYLAGPNAWCKPGMTPIPSSQQSAWLENKTGWSTNEVTMVLRLLSRHHRESARLIPMLGACIDTLIGRCFSTKEGVNMDSVKLTARESSLFPLASVGMTLRQALTTYFDGDWLVLEKLLLDDEAKQHESKSL